MVNFDKSLPDIKPHVYQVICQYGNTDFIDVAGIVVADPFYKWDLIENTSYLNYGELKAEDVFRIIASFKARSDNHNLSEQKMC